MKRIIFCAALTFLVFIPLSCMIKGEVILERTDIGSINFTFPSDGPIPSTDANSRYVYIWSLEKGEVAGPAGKSESGESVTLKGLEVGVWSVEIEVDYYWEVDGATKKVKFGYANANCEIKQGVTTVTQIVLGLDPGIFLVSSNLDGGPIGDCTFTDGTTAQNYLTIEEKDDNDNVTGYLAAIFESQNKVIHSIVIGGNDILIGRQNDSSQIRLHFENGVLAFREPDENGFIPIGSYDELKLIDTKLDGHFILEANLDLLGDSEGALKKEWESIGSAAGSKFTGIFDGNEKELSNFQMDGASGLFNIISYENDDKPGILKNFSIVSGSIKMNADKENVIGSICNESEGGTIYKCSSGVDIEGGGFVGGICGKSGVAGTALTQQKGCIELCGNTGNINYTSEPTAASDDDKYYYVGGVVGLTYAKVAASFNNGNISGKASYMGGVVGYNDKGDVTACLNRGDLLNTHTLGIALPHYTGGVVGGALSDSRNANGTTYDCYNQGPIKGDKAGGVIGWAHGGMVKACYNIGKLSILNPSSSTQFVCGTAHNATRLSNDGIFINCYWEYDGATIYGYYYDDTFTSPATGYGSYNSKEFGTSGGTPSQTWPRRDMSGWDVYNADKPPPASGYWRTCGAQNAGIYPILYFE